jgi:hypothetical protein
LKTTRSRKSSKDQALLISLAESIGSTLGSIAAKAGAAQKALTKRKLTTKLEQEGKNLVRKGKKIARNLEKTRLARSTRRSRPIKRATRRARARK